MVFYRDIEIEEEGEMDMSTTMDDQNMGSLWNISQTIAQYREEDEELDEEHQSPVLVARLRSGLYAPCGSQHLIASEDELSSYLTYQSSYPFDVADCGIFPVA